MILSNQLRVVIKIFKYIIINNKLIKINYFIKFIGYHTCNLVTLSNNKSLIFFGGLTKTGPTSCLEILDLNSGLWQKGCY